MNSPSEICARCPKEQRGYCTAIKPGRPTKELSYCPDGHWTNIVKEEQSDLSEESGICIEYTGKPITMPPYDFEPDPIDLSESAIKDLHYTIYPARQDTTDYHVEMLEDSISQFNGTKVCSLLVDDNTMESRYESKLNSMFDLVNIRINEPRLRETTAFIESLTSLYTTNPNRVICFGHAKNQQHRGPNIEAAIQYWTKALYKYCFNNWEGVCESFKQGYHVTGACRLNTGIKVSKFNWHYSGSFWWARSDKLFLNPFWKNISPNAYGSESYVGHQFYLEESDCLKFDFKDYSWLEFYSLSWWEKFGLQ